MVSSQQSSKISAYNWGGGGLLINCVGVVLESDYERGRDVYVDFPLVSSITLYLLWPLVDLIV